jgi:hypothetical protein
MWKKHGIRRELQKAKGTAHPFFSFPFYHWMTSGLDGSSPSRRSCLFYFFWLFSKHLFGRNVQSSQSVEAVFINLVG